MFHSGGQNQQWSTSGKIGYTSPAVYGGPQHFREGDKIINDPQLGRLATLRVLAKGSKMLYRGGQNQWPTRGHIGYITFAI